MAHHPELDAGVLFSDSLGEEQPPQEWRRAGSLHSHDVPQESRDIRGFFRPSGMSSSTVGAALPPTCAARLRLGGRELRTRPHQEVH